MDADDFTVFARECAGMGGAEAARVFQPFVAYMDGLSPRPIAYGIMCDISPESVEARKKRHLGHLHGYHPALVWHLEKFMKDKR